MTGQFIRLTVRVTVGKYSRDLDIAVPGSSSIAEMLPEVTALAGAPRINRPWQPLTPAGRSVDATMSLIDAGFTHGDLLILEPRVPRPAPVLRDPAEELSAAVGSTRRSSLHVSVLFMSTLGLIGCTFFATLWMPLYAAAALTVAAGVLLLLWQPALPTVTILVILAAGLSGASFMARGTPPGWIPGAIMVSAAAMLLATVVLVPLTRPPFPLLAPAVGIALPAAAGVGGWAFSHTLVSAATFAVAVGIVLQVVAPSLGLALSGLKVPALPTGGQDLAVSDDTQKDAPSRAHRATQWHRGLLAGAAAAITPALLILAVSSHGQPGAAAALGLAIGGAAFLHAQRHAGLIETVSWLSTALAGMAVPLIAAGIAYRDPMAGNIVTVVVMICCALVLTAAISSPFWLPRLPQLNPSQLVWCERAESVALAAVIPLALYLGGVLTAIRGLG